LHPVHPHQHHHSRENSKNELHVSIPSSTCEEVSKLAKTAAQRGNTNSLSFSQNNSLDITEAVHGSPRDRDGIVLSISSPAVNSVLHNQSHLYHMNAHHSHTESNHLGHAKSDYPLHNSTEYSPSKHHIHQIHSSSTLKHQPMQEEEHQLRNSVHILHTQGKHKRLLFRIVLTSCI
jgi:hypothetical protein